MVRQIFPNIAVKDLQRSKDFFGKLGFKFNPQFSDDKAACMIVEDDASYVMLVTEPFFQGFIPGKTIADAKKTTEVLLAFSVHNRQEVDHMMTKVLEAGGKDYRTEDHGFMYGRSFEDPDGHIWEVFYMDQSNAPPTPQAQ